MRFHFRQQRCRADDARGGKECRREDRISVAELGQKTRDAGPDQEADAESNADHAERFGAVLRRGHVGDIGLRERKIAGRESVDDPRQEDQPKRARERQDQESDERADLADDQQRLAPHVVRHPAEDGAGDELAERVGRNQQADDRGRRAEVFRVERKQRQDDRQAEDVNQNDEKNGKKGERFTREVPDAEAKESTFHASAGLARALRRRLRPSL